MLARIRRCLPLGGALSTVLSFVGLAWAGGGGQFSEIVIVAPVSVMAGNPIQGYVTGFTPPCNVTGVDTVYGNLPGSPTSGASDPVFFFFLTFEPMAGTAVDIRAYDGAGATALAVVCVQ